jgi:hypothetical protein
MVGTARRDAEALDTANLQDLPTDEELTALALAADPDAPLGEDAVSLWDVTGGPAEGPLPSWYMPAASGGRLLTGWRRLPPVAVIASLLVINGCGLCITYGKLAFT